MVTQKEAIDSYIQTQTDIETIKVSVQNLEKIIELKLDETKTNITENQNSLQQHKDYCQKTMSDHNKRLIILEQFSSKVIYFYSGVVFLVGIIVGVWGKGLFS